MDLIIVLFDIVLLARKRRPHHTRFISFRDEVPTEPDASAAHILQQKRVAPATVDEIKKVCTVVSV